MSMKKMGWAAWDFKYRKAFNSYGSVIALEQMREVGLVLSVRLRQLASALNVETTNWLMMGETEVIQEVTFVY